MRYGSVKVEAGPAGGAVWALPSPSICIGDCADTLGDGEGALVSGGGSIDECDVGALDGMTGSGKEGISSSMEDVSMVICFVGWAP